MPKIKVGTMTVNYEQEGSGEPLILIPYLAADHACYAFQVAEYSKHFNCISIDLRGTGETDSPAAAYSTETLADDVADLMHALELPAAHISGLSLGAAVGMWLAAKHPAMVKSLSLHSGWTKSDRFLKSVVQSWQATAKGFGSISEMVICGIFPWCFTPEMYAARPEFVQMLAEFVRSRPAQSVESFLRQSNAVMAHDVVPQLGKITAPTQITFGRYDVLTIRFADLMKQGIRNSELLVLEECSHAPIYEKVDEFNARTLSFMKSHVGVGAARA